MKDDDIPFAPPWFESAAELLAEQDPGPTPFLVQSLIVDGAMAVLVGPPKKGKTYVLLDVAIAIATGGKALGRFAVHEPGPVLLVLEESGRAALHRRLDRLTRGRAIAADNLHQLHYAANRRIKLDDEEWKARLRAAALERPWRLIAFDPWARVKGGAVDEDRQLHVGPALDFLRELRDLSASTVLYVAHTGHEGTRQRGSSDFESYYESKLTLVEQSGGKRTLTADHREDEALGPFELSFRFDGATRTLRIDADEDELTRQVREYLEEHPEASANVVREATGGGRNKVLELVKRLRADSGTDVPVLPSTTPPGQRLEGGTPGALFREPGTTSPDAPSQVVLVGEYHPSENGRPSIGDDGYLEHLLAAFEAGHVTESEWRQGERAHRFVVGAERRA